MYQSQVVETQFDNQDEDRDAITGKTNNLRKVLERLHINSEAGSSGQDEPTSSEQSGNMNNSAGELPAQTAQFRLGIIKKVDSAGRTCIVRWLNDAEGDDKGKDKEKEINEEEEGEEVSFYQIMIHSDFKYRLGDVLLRLPKESNGEAMNEGQWVGELIGLKNGKLLVQWSDSTRSWVAPGDVYALDTYVLRCTYCDNVRAKVTYIIDLRTFRYTTMHFLMRKMMKTVRNRRKASVEPQLQRLQVKLYKIFILVHCC